MTKILPALTSAVAITAYFHSVGVVVGVNLGVGVAVGVIVEVGVDVIVGVVAGIDVVVGVTAGVTVGLTIGVGVGVGSKVPFSTHPANATADMIITVAIIIRLWRFMHSRTD